MTLKSFTRVGAAWPSLLARSALAQTGVAANPVERPGRSGRQDGSARRHRQEDRRLKLEDVRMTPVNGIYEITRGSEISYTTSDGRYVILGDMIDIDSDRISPRTAAAPSASALIDTVPESEMLVFSPKNPKYTDHGVHRHRLRLLPPPAFADRRVQPSRHPRALPVLSRAPGPTPSPGTRREPCGARRIATTR
jgi:hypothetical protein